MYLEDMNGKHIQIVPPPGSVSLYFNHKGDFSVVLLTLVDANLKFLSVNVGTNDQSGDGGVWKKTTA